MIALWLALAVLAVLIVYRWASIPQTKGTMQLARTMAGVEILRDRYAVPHIFASTQTDAHFALGLVHAQDRLWQLEFNRRVINGELSQLLGPSTVPIDRMMRVLGLKQASQSAWGLTNNGADVQDLFIEQRHPDRPDEYRTGDS